MPVSDTHCTTLLGLSFGRISNNQSMNSFSDALFVNHSNHSTTLPRASCNLYKYQEKSRTQRHWIILPICPHPTRRPSFLFWWIAYQSINTSSTWGRTLLHSSRGNFRARNCASLWCLNLSNLRPGPCFYESILVWTLSTTRHEIIYEQCLPPAKQRPKGITQRLFGGLSPQLHHRATSPLVPLLTLGGMALQYCKAFCHPDDTPWSSLRSCPTYLDQLHSW